MNGLLKQLFGIMIVLAISSYGEPCRAQETNAAGTNTQPVLYFPVGEELVYQIYWGIIPVGTTTIATEWTAINGKKLLAIRYKSRTNRIFGTIYPVDDTVDSIINPETFLPLSSNFCLTRRNSKSEQTVTFHHDRLKAEMVTASTGKTNELDIAADTRDMLTLLYYLRSFGAATNQIRQFRVVIDTGLLDLKIKAYNYEDIDLDVFGKVSCIRMEPIANLDTLLIEDGRVIAWVAPERCLATKMTIKAPLANVSIELDEVRGPGSDFWSKAMQKTK